MAKKKTNKKDFAMFRKEFLNDNDYNGIAAIMSSIEPENRKEECMDGSKVELVGGSANITISDCSRNINLDFYLWGPYKDTDKEWKEFHKSAKNNKMKIAKLISHFTEFQEKYSKFVEAIEESHKEYLLKGPKKRESAIDRICG